MDLGVVNNQGKNIGTVALLNDVVSTKKAIHLVQEAVVQYLANQRQGTAKAKTRAEVSGSGKKPWKQKGTGRARAGSIRSPLWRHGGVIFAPHQRDFSIAMPQKKKQRALLLALVAKQAKGEVVVVDAVDTTMSKTKVVAQWLKDRGFTGTTVLVMHAIDAAFLKACRNIPTLTLTTAAKLSVYDVLAHDKVVLHKDTVQIINDKAKAKV